VDGVDLRASSDDPLFVFKRADTLWKLLDAKRVFRECLSNGRNDPFANLMAHPRGERALAIALLETRKAGLSSQVMDVSVCGAVPPYNGLLGGKLVALLGFSRHSRPLSKALRWQAERNKFNDGRSTYISASRT
jgi:hypothetical protein